MNDDIKKLYENIVKTYHNQLVKENNNDQQSTQFFTKEEFIKLIKFVEKHSNEYDAIADSTAFDLKNMLLEKIKRV